MPRERHNPRQLLSEFRKILAEKYGFAEELMSNRDLMFVKRFELEQLKIKVTPSLFFDRSGEPVYYNGERYSVGIFFLTSNGKECFQVVGSDLRKGWQIALDRKIDALNSLVMRVTPCPSCHKPRYPVRKREQKRYGQENRFIAFHCTNCKEESDEITDIVVSRDIIP